MGNSSNSTSLNDYLQIHRAGVDKHVFSNGEYQCCKISCNWFSKILQEFMTLWAKQLILRNAFIKIWQLIAECRIFLNYLGIRHNRKGTLFDWFVVDVMKLFSVGQMEKKLLFFRGIAISLIVKYKPSLFQNVVCSRSFAMDIKTLLDNLHDEVSCSVCMSTFTDPKQLPCFHSYCL